MSVYELKLKDNLAYKRISERDVEYIEKDIVEKIIEAWKDFKNGTVFNSANIRLEDVCFNEKQVELVIGHTRFYDFLISNIIRQQFDGFKEFIIKSNIKEGKEIINELEHYFSSIKGNFNSFQELIRKGNMPNAIAVSVLVMDKNDNVMLVKRSSKVAIGKNLYSVTATGAAGEPDFEDDNPIKHCALRELKEELNLKLSTSDLYIKAIVAGKNKMQPIAIVDAIVPFNLEKIKIEKDAAFDYKFEVDKVFICKKDEIKNTLIQQKFTEAAVYHLESI